MDVNWLVTSFCRNWHTLRLLQIRKSIQWNCKTCGMGAYKLVLTRFFRKIVKSFRFNEILYYNFTISVYWFQIVQRVTYSDARSLKINFTYSYSKCLKCFKCNKWIASQSLHIKILRRRKWRYYLSGCLHRWKKTKNKCNTWF